MLSELDVGLGFAHIAGEMKYVRPGIDASYVVFDIEILVKSAADFSFDCRKSLHIIDGRHPTVEIALGVDSARTFTPNSLVFSPPENLIHLITGANAAGKSTFLRQAALIVLLGQCGSFVPARSCSFGVVDR